MLNLLCPRQSSAAARRWSGGSLFVALVLVFVLFRAARGDSYNPATFRGVYGKNDLATAEANDEAVRQAIETIAKTGGGDLVLTGSLAITKTIQPPTTSLNGTPGWPVNFAIRGSGANAELHDVDGGLAVEFPEPKYPANLPGADLRQGLERLAIRGGGVKITAGGKFLVVDRLRMYGVRGVDYGFDVKWYDGGFLTVYIHDSPVTGFRLDACHHTLVDLTSRANAAGGTIIDSTLSGRVYNESNKGLGLDLDRLNRSTLAVWLENNTGQFQARRRNCFGNTFSGQDHVDTNQGWDDDAVSALANQTTSSLAAFADPPGAERLPPAVCGASSTPAGVFDVSGGKAMLRAGSFALAKAFTPAGNPHWLRLAAEGKATLGGSWQPGDTIVVAARFQLDAAAQNYFETHESARILLGVGSATGSAPKQMAQAWVPTGSRRELVTFGTASAAGTGLAVYLNPQTGSTSGPEEDLGITATADVWILRGK